MLPTYGGNAQVTLFSDFNLFYGNAAEEVTYEYSLSDWQTMGFDGSSFEADPQFVSGTDLHIQSTSPAVNAGQTLTHVVGDIDGQSRDSWFDIGADEVN